MHVLRGVWSLRCLQTQLSCLKLIGLGMEVQVIVLLSCALQHAPWSRFRDRCLHSINAVPAFHQRRDRCLHSINAETGACIPSSGIGYKNVSDLGPRVKIAVVDNNTRQCRSRSRAEDIGARL